MKETSKTSTTTAITTTMMTAASEATMKTSEMAKETNPEALNETDESSAARVNQAINKLAQGIKDGNKIQRKNALDSMKKQICETFEKKKAAHLNNESCKSILRLVLAAWHDSMEKCRQLGGEMVATLLENAVECHWDDECTLMTLATLVQRLGGKEVKESSEEIRLQLYELLEKLLSNKNVKTEANSNFLSSLLFESHLGELVELLVNSFYDNYAEVKKKGCSCARLVAQKLAASNFHMQSEALVKPLLTNLTHQHSRVRKDTVDCLCEVIMRGANKSASEALPHLAQRLFDQAPMVRMAVLRLVGVWLLDMPDRYSYHHRLLPLLLTGLVDEALEARELAATLWWDVGIKYANENEQELKDKLDYLSSGYVSVEKNAKSANDYYMLIEELEGKQRPNLGCRELVRSNAGKILPAILNDISDWVEETRIKSIQLLYVLIWQTEANITQHLEITLQILVKASNENLELIQEYIFKCAKLIGYFTDASLSVPLTLKAMRRMSAPTHGAVNLLNGLLAGLGSSLVSSSNSAGVKFTLEQANQVLMLLEEISLTFDV
jgi:dynein assembly factor 5, axonemal